MLKFCNSCGHRKVLTDFGIRKASKDGHSSKCKACQSAYDRLRSQSPARAQQRREYQHGIGKERANEAKRNYIKRNPQKRSATIAVGNAIRDGKLIKKCCEVCGNAESFAHHDDYSKPLLVRWLCDFHHKEWHKSNEPIC